MTQQALVHSITYGTTQIDYDVCFSRRRTLAISVHPDGSVCVHAPQGSDTATIAAIVQKRGGWILQQKYRFANYAPPIATPREYVSGESYRYLGRQYRLKVLDGTPNALSLGRTDLLATVRNRDPEAVRRLLERWYRTEARRVFHERLQACFPRVAHLGVAYPPLVIRRMKTRWGSCSRDGKILLNPRLIQAPIAYIDYVIVHELCHLKEHNHSKRYYTLLDTAMPDWRDWRQRLNTYEFI